MEEKRTWRISFYVVLLTSSSGEQGKNSYDGIPLCSLYLSSVSSAAIPPSASRRLPGLKISDKTLAFANPLPASLSAPHKGNRHEKPWHKSIIHTSAIIH
jgi:hypothetical protein